MKSPFFHITTATTLLLSMPFHSWGGEEVPLSAVSPQFAPMQSMVAIGKLLAAFLIIGALMALLFKGMKKMGLGHGSVSKGGLITVLDTRMIAPKKYISVVRVAGEDLAIGISDTSMTLLCKLGPGATDSTPRNTARSEFDHTLSQAHTQTKEAASA